MFVQGFQEPHRQRMISRDSVPPETYFQLLIEMLRVTWLFFYLDDLHRGLMHLANLVYDTLCGF